MYRFTTIICLSIILFTGIAGAFIEEKGPSTKWAFIMGIEQYKDAHFQRSSDARKNGEQIAWSLKEIYGYSGENVIELYDDNATEGSIHEWISRIAKLVGPNDTFFAYLENHIMVANDGGYYLIPHDGILNQPWTLVPMDRILQLLGTIQAKASLMILGECIDLPLSYEKKLKELEYSRRSFHLLALPCRAVEANPMSSNTFHQALLSALSGREGVAGFSANWLSDHLQKKYQLPLVRYSSPYGKEFTLLPIVDERLIFLTGQLHREENVRTRLNAISELVDVLQKMDVGQKSAWSDRFMEITRDSNEDLNVRNRAIWAIGELKSKEAIPHLTGLFMNSGENSLRESSLEALLKIDDQVVLPRLLDALKQPDPGLCIAAIQAIGRLKDRRALGSLLDLLHREQNGEVRVAALEIVPSLKPLNPDELEMILRLLNDPDAQVKREAVNSLGKLGDVRAVPELVRLLKQDESSAMRQASAYALGRLCDETNRKIILDALIEASKKDKTIEVREAAAFSLGSIGGEQAEKRLIDLLKAKKEDIRVIRTAAERLGELKSIDAVDPLLELLKNDKPELRRAAVIALGTIGDRRAMKPLLYKLKDEDVYVRTEVSRALEKFETRDNTSQESDDLIKGLEDASPRVRIESAQKLTELKDPEMVPHLIALLSDEDYDVRQTAIVMLTKFSDDVSLRRIAGALRDNNFLKRQGAASVLGSNGNPELALILAEHAGDLSSAVRAEVIASLGKIGDQRSVSVLFDAFSDHETIVRESAAAAMAAFVSRSFQDHRMEEGLSLSREVFQLSGRTLGQEHPWTLWFNLISLMSPAPSVSLKMELHEEQGAAVKCFIRNESAEDVHVCLLRLKTDGEIRLIYPQNSLRAELLSSRSVWESAVERDPNGIWKVFVHRKSFALNFISQEGDRKLIRSEYQRILGKGDPFSEMLAGRNVDGEGVNPADWVGQIKVSIGAH